MPPSSKKRSAPPSSGVSTRSSKVAKTDSGDVLTTKTEPKAKKGKQVPAASAFKKMALPLHVHITHTPPTAEVDPSKEAPLSKDVGHVTSLTLLASNFSTGSYGWKGSKKAIVELVGSEGKTEKVQVQLTINATVVGSKDAEDGEDGEVAEGADEANGEEDAQVEAEVAVEEKAVEKPAAEE